MNSTIKIIDFGTAKLFSDDEKMKEKLGTV